MDTPMHMTWREKMAAGIDLTDEDVKRAQDDTATEIIDKILAERAVRDGQASFLVARPSPGQKCLSSLRTMGVDTEAWVYSCKDNTRDEGEGRHYAEVIRNPGEDSEVVLFTTTWHTSPHPAITQAEGWMKANGVREAAD